MYEIRLCKNNELELLKKFLRNSWSKDHIFLKNIEILDFQHKTQEGYNFVVAYHLETKCFHGVLGIISPDFYTNRKLSKNQDIWIAIWKVDKKLSQSNSIGFDMIEYVKKEFIPKSLSAININDKVSLVYKLMGFKIETMNHWFLPNKKVFKPKLIKGILPPSSYESENSIYKTIECGIKNKTQIQNFLSKNKSKRNFSYLARRYLAHPTYKYNIYAFLQGDSNLHAIIVGRNVISKGATIFRITELFYENQSVLSLKTSLENIMFQKGYEYIDFLEYGFESKIFIKCGFINCSDNLYVPNLFEPFVPELREVKIAFKSKYPFSCTKGDSDLDRPNQS